ncbi:MAG: protein kinase [Myxococcales bacterium]|nr:protein kinase [Myxococcales bacterium]
MLSPPALGDVVSGRYRLVRVRARGASAIVFEAVDERDGQRIALKVLRPEALGFQGIGARFEQEARLLASLSSEHVVRVIDVGTTDAGLPCLALELLEGHDLGAEIARGRLEPARATALVRQACAALAEAHDRGIVHRDIKPANLFLASDERGRTILKVLDFGISKDEGHGEALTSAGVPLGTPIYMAPEQFYSAHAVDARCDVWALGVVLFEMLAGCAPFEGQTAEDVAAAVLAPAPAPRLSVFRSDLPEALVEVVARCLEKEIANRIPTVRALASALAPFDVSPPEPQPSEPAPAAIGPGEKVMPRFTLALAIGSGIALAVLLVALTILVVRRVRQSDTSPLARGGTGKGEPTVADALARPKPDADAWQACLVAAGTEITLPALATSGTFPDVERDIDPLLSGKHARLVLRVPWASDSKVDGSLFLTPITPLAPAFRRGAADVVVVTSQSVSFGRVGASALADLGNDTQRLVERLSSAPRVVLVEGETPLTKLASVARALGSQPSPVALAVVARSGGEPSDKGVGIDVCPPRPQRGPAFEPSSRAAIDKAARDVVRRCALAAPGAAGSKLDVFVRTSGGGSPTVCLESAELPSTRLYHCVASGFEGAVAAGASDGSARLSLVFEVPEVRALCGPGD